MPQPTISRSLQLALAIGLLYVVLGAAWILGSDWLVGRVSQDTAWLALAQRWKGLAYVALTGLGLVVLVHAGYTRLQRLETRARRRELQVEDLFQHHPTPMWVFDEDTLRFLAVNEAAVAAYGYSRAEFLKMTLRDIRPPEDVPEFERVRQLKGNAAKVAGVWRHRRKDGQLVHVRVTRHSIVLRGRRAGLVTADDLTPLVQAQEALAEQEARLRQLHAGLQEVLWLSDVSGQHISYVSPAFEQVCGRPARDFLADARLWREVVHPQDLDIARGLIHRVARAGHAQAEYRIVRPDGSMRWVSDRRRQVLDSHGQAQWVAGILEDISAARAHQMALRRWNETLEQEVAARTADLRMANEELEAFARTAAHDLKTPLNAVSGFVQILGLSYGDLLGEHGRQLVLRIDQASRTMSALIDDLLRLSRVTTHELQVSTVDLAAMAREVLAQLAADHPHRQVDCVLPETLPARGDPGLIRPLLVNLLDNAWKYTGKLDQGRIELGCTSGSEGPVYFVSDNGVGFDGRRAQGLFKPFHRLHTGTEFSGTGVGLATCQRIVRRHGGDIWVTSTPGQGTTVYFTLERLPTSATQGPPRTPEAPGGPAPAMQAPTVQPPRPATSVSTEPGGSARG